MQFTLNEYPYCDGGYAEYYYLPPGHYVFKVPDMLPDEAIPPVNCALCQVLHGIEYADMKFGDIVVIQGAGGLGIYAAAVAAEKGASQGHLDRQAAAAPGLAKNCGATHVIDINEFPTPESRVQQVKDLTDGRGADIVVEVVGHRRGHARGARHGPLQRQVRRHRQHRARSPSRCRPPRSSRSRSSGAA